VLFFYQSERINEECDGVGDLLYQVNQHQTCLSGTYLHLDRGDSVYRPRCCIQCVFLHGIAGCTTCLLKDGQLIEVVLKVEGPMMQFTMK